MESGIRYSASMLFNGGNIKIVFLKTDEKSCDRAGLSPYNMFLCAKRNFNKIGSRLSKPIDGRWGNAAQIHLPHSRGVCGTKNRSHVMDASNIVQNNNNFQRRK